MADMSDQDMRPAHIMADGDDVGQDLASAFLEVSCVLAPLGLAKLMTSITNTAEDRAASHSLRDFS